MLNSATIHDKRPSKPWQWSWFDQRLPQNLLGSKQHMPVGETAASFQRQGQDEWTAAGTLLFLNLGCHQNQYRRQTTGNSMYWKSPTSPWPRGHRLPVARCFARLHPGLEELKAGLQPLWATGQGGGGHSERPRCLSGPGVQRQKQSKGRPRRGTESHHTH